MERRLLNTLEVVKLSLQRDGVVRRSEVEWLVSEIDKLTHSLSYLNNRCDKLTAALKNVLSELSSYPDQEELVEEVNKKLLGGGVEVESGDVEGFDTSI